MAPRQIKPGELGHFSIDEDTNRLYWNNNLIQTESVVVLSAKQTLWGIVLAVATILGALATCAYTGIYIWTTLHPRNSTVQNQTSESKVVPAVQPPVPASETAPFSQSAPKSPSKKISSKQQQ